MQATNRRSNMVVALAIALMAATLIGATVWTPAKKTPATSPVAKTDTLAPMSGTFTGEFENGVPVYRLPAITVTTSRSAELAKMASEEHFAAK